MKAKKESKLCADMLENEYWWGGNVHFADKMPFDSSTVCSIDLLYNRYTQTVPFFLSSKGRYIWSDDSFKISFDKGKITACGRSPIELEIGGKTLRDAYIAARDKHFPFEKDMKVASEFFEKVQFNTWMEFITDQTEENILKYAHEIIENGYKPGIIMIDDGWQNRFGTWDFDPTKFSNPKKMIEELHALGFIVMIWVTPFVSLDTDDFYALSGIRGGDGKKHLVRVQSGEYAIFQWWNGYSGMFNLCLPQDREFLKSKLDRLINEFGIDGFKFDGGVYRPNTVVTGECDGYNYDGGYTTDMLNRAWLDFGRSYKFHEFKDTFKYGGLRMVQRLFDKNHKWQGNGIDCLVPHGIFVGLTGCPYVCPDMVGGGEWKTFLSGNYDEELFVRMAQASALFPMMQFSSAPWRHLSEKNAKLCLEAARLHEKFTGEIKSLVEDAQKSGEPVIRSMEYNYPDCGYEKINDQFMLGKEILVAPVVEQGQRVKKVVFPSGKWQDITDGKIYEGGTTVDIPAPIEKLPAFKAVK